LPDRVFAARGKRHPRLIYSDDRAMAALKSRIDIIVGVAIGLGLSAIPLPGETRRCDETSFVPTFGALRHLGSHLRRTLSS
jgi:hypothetical protein